MNWTKFLNVLFQDSEDGTFGMDNYFVAWNAPLRQGGPLPEADKPITLHLNEFGDDRNDHETVVNIEVFSDGSVEYTWGALTEKFQLPFQFWFNFTRAVMESA